jgi:hypothetical protein
MVDVVRTVSEPARTARRTRPLGLLRAVGVVSGGPLALAVSSAVAPVSLLNRWPSRIRSPRVRRAAWAATGAGLVVPWVYLRVVRPYLQHWGATEEEQQARLPGDTPDRKPLSVTTRAVTVEAPADEVWRWLVQIGQGRGGFYSYDWLENLAGCHIHSADRIQPELQHLAAGDELRLAPDFATRFTEVDPPRSLVIENWGSYVVEPLDAGHSRLIARSHVDAGPGALGYYLAIELPHAVMERKMLLGIKRRAEKAAASAA